MSAARAGIAGVVFIAAMAAAVSSAQAQSLGTLRWRLDPFCNVVTLTVTQTGSVFTLDGYDDQCSSPQRAPVTGVATFNPDGTVGFGFTIITTPGGKPVHVDARISTATLSGPWTDTAGNSGTFTFGAGPTSGTVRPPATVNFLPAPFSFLPNGGFAARSVGGTGTLPVTGNGVRMMWSPEQAAFRAGEVTGTQWDLANIGYASAALGHDVRANGAYSFAAGRLSTASGGYSTALGYSTVASGTGSLAAGLTTSAGGNGSVALGVGSSASGDGSMALGTNAATSAVAPGSFVYGDRSTSGAVTSISPNQFLVRAAGGTAFWSTAGTTYPTSPGVILFTGDSAWSSLSDVNAKENFRDLDDGDVLTRIAAMPVREWNYKAQDQGIRHIGPTAQDFHAAFGLGQDERRINTLDADGVALAAIKALEARTRADNDRLTRDNDELRASLARLEQQVLELRAAPTRPPQ
ncbi:MAG: tail fiber domain-containing protein [Vicinamibacterales bacterium]